MKPVAAYDYDTVIANLMNDGMSHDDACEFFDFNIIGAWMGDSTPLFVRLCRQPTPRKSRKKRGKRRKS